MCLRHLPIHHDHVGGDQIRLQPPPISDAIQIGGVTQSASPKEPIAPSVVGDNIGIETFQFPPIQELHLDEQDVNGWQWSLGRRQGGDGLEDLEGVGEAGIQVRMQ